ncbi:PaaI family thioesterase [Paenibacillus flagellatus]|uniref:Thioesterase n=1 Tax=Paenibacillus flagellatus TaxID=2211139 RepID=A0A2V5KCF3_9BACL|nr:PaaI family thioesterase [Paenibacillus flagellatus]PYI55844.1 thioesterase [Paenibacillus flagellatus]
MDANLENWMRKLEEAARGTFWDDLRCRLAKAEPGLVVVSLLAERRHLNGIGLLHGGVHASLLDSAMGIVAMIARPGDSVVTTNMNIHYLTPLGLGPITVTAELVHESRKTVTARGRVEDGEGRLGSWGSASFRVVGGEAPAVRPS